MLLNSKLEFPPLMEQMTLIQELNQGKELAEQLRNHLRPPSSSAGILLIDKILCSYEKALSALGGEVTASPAATKSAVVSKKRKVMGKSKWSEQVKVPSGAGLEAPLGDGFSWRKYGQKDILGSKFPRGYFRCSHRYSQGCLATKQVQKSDKDPTIYDITYKGRHTCDRVLHSTTTPQEQKPLVQHPMPPKQEQMPLQHGPSCSGFGMDAVRVKSENLDNVDGGIFRFRTPSPWYGSEVRGDHSPFEESEFGGVLSPTTFESSDAFGLCCIGDRAWDSDFGFVSVPNSVSNAPIGDLEEYCSFDNLELFC